MLLYILHTCVRACGGEFVRFGQVVEISHDVCCGLNLIKLLSFGLEMIFVGGTLRNVFWSNLYVKSSLEIHDLT